MSETQELKPCWCCNAPALLERASDHHGEWFNLGCSRHWEAVPDRSQACPAGRIWYTADPDEMEAAITAWNARPTEDRLVGALEEAERALEALKAKVAPLVELAEKATPGPWKTFASCLDVWVQSKGGVAVAQTGDINWLPDPEIPRHDDRTQEQMGADGLYVAAAHPAKIIETATDIDAALTRIRAAKGGE